MRSSSLGSSLGAAWFDHNNGFCQGHFAGGREKSSGVADRFHVNDYAFCMRVISKVINEIAPVHVQHRADGDKMAKPNILPQTPVQDGSTQCAALANEPHAATPGNRCGKGGVQAADRTHHTQAVWSDNAHVAAAGMFQDLTF